MDLDDFEENVGKKENCEEERNNLKMLLDQSNFQVWHLI